MDNQQNTLNILTNVNGLK